jgi:HD-like signal output (HDOD) protein/CheY-like chemotaxis protein
MQRILFVDDMRTVLLGLERLLRGQRDQWVMGFANSAAEALALLEKEPFDVIVSDVVMPEMDGVELLTIVAERYPQMVRFILSGHANPQARLKSVEAAHQFLPKPCSRELLVTTISRALALRDLFKHEGLLNLVKDAISIPTLPALYQELAVELAAENSSAERVAQIIARDITVSAKVLHLVNSAFFGCAHEICNIRQAVAMLGSETISSIVLTTSVFKKFDAYDVSTFRINEIYEHSIRVGRRTAKLIRRIGLEPSVAEEALLAGMMHDLGKLVLIASENQEWRTLYLQRQSPDCSLYELEREHFGVTHSEVGAYLLSIWGFSSSVVESVAFHHNPGAAPVGEVGLLTALYLANLYDLHAANPDPETWGFDREYLSAIGFMDQVNDTLAFFSTDESPR